MEKKSVFIINGGHDYANMFLKEGWELAINMAEADLVLFTGGEDVTPEIYGERQHPKTWPNPNRDRHETKLYKEALELGIPMAGICRGGQFLNVMNGGKMWQNVNNHLGRHNAFVGGYIGNIVVSSTHHQMMRPNLEAPHLVLMTANLATIKENCGKTGIVVRHFTKNDEDVESVFYPETRCLSYQPHPEHDNVSQCRKVYFHFINNYLLEEKSFGDAAHEMMDNSINERTVQELLLNAA